MAILRLSRLVLRVAISLILALAILWAAAALWIDGPASRLLAGALAGGLVLIAVTAAMLIRPRRRAAIAVFVPCAAVLAWWLTLAPSNALTQNCTTTIWHHTKAVGAGPPLDWRLLANGYLVDLAYERGTVNTGIGLDEPKRRSDITLRACAASGREDFSQLFREGLPPRPPQGFQSAAAQVP